MADYIGKLTRPPLPSLGGAISIVLPTELLEVPNAPTPDLGDAPHEGLASGEHVPLLCDPPELELPGQELGADADVDCVGAPGSPLGGTDTEPTGGAGHSDPSYEDPPLAADAGGDDQDEDESDYRPLSPDFYEPQFLFIAGTAGTGKTYIARQRAEQYRDAKLTATTGIAAINLSGTTINALLYYSDTDSLQLAYEVGRLHARLHALADSGYTRLIIDEVSMMDGRQLDILCLAFDEVNARRHDQGKAIMGITLVGDFAQLPPVKAPFIFEKAAWERFEANTITLTEPRRQADPHFVHALQAVRRGDKAAALAYFKPLIHSAEDRRFDGTTILAKNDEVERYNKIRMLELTTKEESFQAQRTGDGPSEWKNIPSTLVLKPGALVMILSNRRYVGTEDLQYCNGDLAHYVSKINEQTALVNLVRTGEDVIVSKIIREKLEATGAKGVKKERDKKLAHIDYMPLRVAYATTCHKSQGLSLDRVQIMFHSMFWSTPGMLYVALSRARTPEGLRLVGTEQQFSLRVKSNPLIQRWL